MLKGRVGIGKLKDMEGNTTKYSSTIVSQQIIFKVDSRLINTF